MRTSRNRTTSDDAVRDPALAALPAAPRRGVLATLSDFLRWLLFVVLATAVFASFALYLVYAKLDEEIRRHAESGFQSHFAHLQVRVNSARRLDQQGIELRGISIRDPRQPEARAELVYIDELLVQCETDLRCLVSGQIFPRQLVVRRLRLTAELNSDGTWNLSSLLPQFGGRPPSVIVQHSVVELRSQGRETNRLLLLQDLDLAVDTVPTDLDGSPAAGAAPERRRFRGRARSPLFESASIEGEWNTETGAWLLRGMVEAMEVSPSSLTRLPDQVANRMEFAKSLRGNAHARFSASGVPGDPSRSQLIVAGSFGGRVEDPRLPRPLTDVRVTFRYDNNVLRIQDAAARSGETTLQMNGAFAAVSRCGPFHVVGRAQRLVLDEELSATLPEPWKSSWAKLSPRGIVDAEFDVSFDGQRWNQDLLLNCRDVSFAYHKFPYRLENGTGVIRYKQGVLQLDGMRAMAGGREVRIAGQFVQPGPAYTGWLEFTMNEPIPLDEKLLGAVPDKSQRIVRSLNPHGMLTLWGRFERQSANPPVDQKRLEVRLVDCSLNYDRFPYPLHRVRGTLRMQDDQWTFSDLEGFNDSGWVKCRGTWTPTTRGDSLLALDVSATDVPLEDELRDALRPDVQRIWNQLRPRGTIDDLNVTVRYASSARQLSVGVTALKRPPNQNVEGRSISVKPVWLPYQWDDVVGQIRFLNGVVQLDNMHASRGATQIQFSGDAQVVSPGTWRVRLRDLNVDRATPTPDLIAALPERLGKSLAQLQIEGLASVSGSLELTGGTDGSTLPQAAWDLNLDLENGTVRCGVPLEHIHGGMSFRGNFDGQTANGLGELSVDSLICQGIQLTRISGPLQLDDVHVRCGEWIPQDVTGQPPRPITALLWGGVLEGSAQLVFEDNARFEVEGKLIDGDLLEISRNATRQPFNVTGRAFANVWLNGNSLGLHTLRGEGRLLLREADIYELPLMVRLLSLLSLKRPERTAFTSSDVDLRIEGDRIYLDQIDFDGDAISLDGHGEVNLRRQIDLTFGTAVGRDGYYVSLLRPFFKEAGRQLMVIRITGTLDEPQMKRELVPQLNETFQQMFPALANRRGTMASRTLDRQRSAETTRPR